MKKAFSLAALLVAFYLNIHAQTLTAMRDSIPGGYDFWFYEPCNGSKHFDSQSPKKPLVVYLHGKSLSGHDLNKVRRYGTIHAIEKGLDIDAFVAAPQTTPPSWNPEKVWQMVQWCCAHYPIDRDRIYVLGMSMGGQWFLQYRGRLSRQVRCSNAHLRQLPCKELLQPLHHPHLRLAWNRRS